MSDRLRRLLRRLSPIGKNLARADGPIFCIVTPAFNSERYIDATIESIVNQAGAFRIRYHVQDGGSRDGTLARIKEWAARVSRREFSPACQGVEFSFDSSPDRGMYDAINKGFVALEPNDGTFMTWLNSDDCLMPGALSLVSHLFQRFENIQWLGGRPGEMDEHGRITRIHDVQVYSDKTLAAGLHEGNHLPFVMQEGTFWRSQLWSRVGGLNRNLRMAGDFDLWRRMAAHASYVSVDTLLAGHRRHAGQLTETVAPYYAEVDDLLRGATGDLRDTEWAKFRNWYVPAPRARDSVYTGFVVVYQSGSREWTMEQRPVPTPLGGTVHVQEGVGAAISARYISGFAGEDHAYAHLNLPKGSSMCGPRASLEFVVESPGRYQVLLRCRNFSENLQLMITHGEFTLVNCCLPATGHDRDCVIRTDAHFVASRNVLEIQLTESPGCSRPALLVLSCEAVPLACLENSLTGDPNAARNRVAGAR